jgi:hypothetical protein
VAEAWGQFGYAKEAITIKVHAVVNCRACAIIVALVLVVVISCV